MNRGDIYHVDLEPTKGHEQRGKRFVFVVTTKEFNRNNLPMICPITAGGAAARLAGFTVTLATSGLKTTGVVLCNQLRSIDVKERNGKFIEKAPAEIIDEVLAVLQDILA